MTIVKEPPVRTDTDKLQAAGNAAERQMAFYLRRAFADVADVLVFNDLRLVENGDAAQIDHLVLHAAGAIIIESKSVTQKVRVNCRGEWARLWDGSWRGMPSPVIQAQQQAEFLRQYLEKRRETLRDKVLLGLVQRGFQLFDMAVLVAISDSGIIERDSPDQAPEALKADQVVAEVKAHLKRQRKAASMGTVLLGKSDDVRPQLRADEFQRLVDVLKADDTRSPAPAKTKPAKDPWGLAAKGEAVPPPELPTAAPVAPPAGAQPAAACKKCASTNLAITYGKFGYYWKCQDCGSNTAIDKTAPDGTQGTIKKRGPAFFLVYGDGLEVPFHTNETVSA